MKNRVGRPNNFKNPDEMLNAFNEFVKYTKEQKRYKYQLSQRSGEMIPEKLEIPLTLEGFNVFCFERYGLVKQYFVNQDKLYDEFITICTYIKEQIRQDQIIGGMVGQYNANITARLNGLVEKQELNISEQPLFAENT